VSQVIDYAIARRIVDLHSGSMEDMERVYTTEEIQRYITFARLFKPQVLSRSFINHLDRFIAVEVVDYQYQLIGRALVTSCMIKPFIVVYYVHIKLNCINHGSSVV